MELGFCISNSPYMLTTLLAKICEPHFEYQGCRTLCLDQCWGLRVAQQEACRDHVSKSAKVLGEEASACSNFHLWLSHLCFFFHTSILFGNPLFYAVNFLCGVRPFFHLFHKAIIFIHSFINHLLIIVIHSFIIVLMQPIFYSFYYLLNIYLVPTLCEALF